MLCRTAGGIPLYDEQLGAGCALVTAVGELAGEAKLAPGVLPERLPILAPAQVTDGEAFPVEVQVYSQGLATGEVLLKKNDKTLDTKKVSLLRGLNRITFEPRITGDNGAITLEADANIAGDPFPENNVFRAALNVVGQPKILYAEGCKITESLPDWNADEVVLGDPVLNAKRIEDAAKVAAGADLIILALGGNEQTSREAWAPKHKGDRDSLDLLGNQDALVKAVLATGKPVVAVSTPEICSIRCSICS